MSGISALWQRLNTRLGGTKSSSPVPVFRSHDYCLTFSDFIQKNWKELSKMARRTRFSPNATIYAVGDAPAAIYCIEDGRVKLVRVSLGGESKTMGLFEKGDIFGEVCLCGMHPREEQAIALAVSDIIGLDAAGLMRAADARPELLLELTLILCARLHESMDQIARLVFDDTRRRLAKELIALDRSFNPGGIEPQPITLTHEELASLVSTTREKVTAVLNEFRRLGLVQYGNVSIRANRRLLEAYLTNGGPAS